MTPRKARNVAIAWAVIGLLFGCAVVFASVSSTSKTNTTVMRLEGKTAVTLKDSTDLGTAHDQCQRTTAATPGSHTCTDVYSVVTVATCADEPAPRIYLPLVDLPDGNGSKGYELPEMEPPTLKAGSDSEFMPERQWLYVRNPKGDAAYPTCWVRGWEEPGKWRANSVKDPGKVFLELITPQNAAENVELPNTMELTYHNDAEKAVYDAYMELWNSPEEVARRAEYERTHPPVSMKDCSLVDCPG